MAVRTVPDPERAAGPAGADAVRRRAADARDRTSADDAAEDPDSRRADARTCAGDPGDAVESARALATDHRHHRVARGAERDVCASARRPRLCARTRADRLGGRPGPVRSRGRRRVPLKIPKREATHPSKSHLLKPNRRPLRTVPTGTPLMRSMRSALATCRRDGTSTLSFAASKPLHWIPITRPERLVDRVAKLTLRAVASSQRANGSHGCGHARLRGLYRHVIGNAVAAEFRLHGLRDPDRRLGMGGHQNDQYKRNDGGQDQKSSRALRLGAITRFTLLVVRSMHGRLHGEDGPRTIHTLPSLMRV